MKKKILALLVFAALAAGSFIAVFASGTGPDPAVLEHMQEKYDALANRSEEPSFGSENAAENKEDITPREESGTQDTAAEDAVLAIRAFAEELNSNE